MEFVTLYWPALAIGLLIGAIVGYLAFRPRQRVRLSDATPLRPHMAIEPATEGRGVADGAAAAASDVGGMLLGARVHAELPGAGGPPDELQQLKGVGPKFAALLGAHGISRLAQLAQLTPDQLHALDAAMGPFRGRLARDRIAEQADYLSRGDTDGYQKQFGKL